MRASDMLRRARFNTARSLSVFVRDVGRGLLEVSHNTLALMGLIALTLGLFAGGHAEMRHQVEQVALEWLKTRHEARQEVQDQASDDLLASVAEPDAVSRATAASLKDLPRQQATLASWIARRYKVAPEPVAALVQEAFMIGQRAGLDPTLILAIMAVESSFNPFAQSAVGAQGLMQVMTNIHHAKYENFGGKLAAFDPVTNLRVGVKVLQECIARAGSVEAGLKFYVGAANLESDGGYAAKVMAEHARLQAVVGGRAPTYNSSPAMRTRLVVPPSASPIIDRDADDKASEKIAGLATS